MKKFIPLFFLFTALVWQGTNAQIVNNSFENWKLDTFYFAAGTVGSLPADTTMFSDPVGWTTSNLLTKLDSIGNVTLVTQSNDSYTGNLAIQMVTDHIHLPVIPSLPLSEVTIPGFALNGGYDLSAIHLSATGTISPISIAGAGQPFNQRLATIKGYYNYDPVFNPGTGSFDTCIVWATLRKGSTLVANAIFKSTDSTGGYQMFSADFKYVSCEIPDTLVILLASSVPNVQTFLYGQNVLIPGSKLLVDSIFYDVLPGNFHFAPFAKRDLFTIGMNTIDTLNVVANDTDCSGTQLNVSIIGNPHHGTASVANNRIVYTPNTGYLGLDSLFYLDTNNSSDTASALCIVYVAQSVGIDEVTQLAVHVYPVPSTGELHVVLENNLQTTARVFDMVGNEVMHTVFSKADNTLNVGQLANGMYSIQLYNENNAVVGRSKFVVSK